MVYRGRGVEELGEGEHELLNRATVDFATAKRPKPPAPKRPRPVAPKPTALEAARRQAESQSQSSGPLEIPKSPPTFWWKK